jgi:hypothetical protein
MLGIAALLLAGAIFGKGSVMACLDLISGLMP